MSAPKWLTSIMTNNAPADSGLAGKIVKVLRNDKLMGGGGIHSLKYIVRNSMMMKKYSGGDRNTEQTFYIIRHAPPGTGFFANNAIILIHLAYAVQKRYIPVIDMENYKTLFSEDTPVDGTMNAWEYYFEQPTVYSLSEAYKSKNVYISIQGFPRKGLSCDLSTFYDNKAIVYYNQVIRATVKLKQNVSEYLESRAKGILQKGKRVLGVATRGTDYTKCAPKGHARQPSVEELIEIIRCKISEWDIDLVYVLTEEHETLQKLQDAFQEKLVFTDSMRHRDYSGDMPIPVTRFDRENDRYQTNLDYLTDVIILSRCDYLIGTRTNGCLAAVLINGGRYKEKHIIDLGNY